jgi:cytochrome c peroxidase
MKKKVSPAGILALALSGGFCSLAILPADPEIPARIGKTSYLPMDLTEPFPALRDRLSAGKKETMARQKALLEDRYDLGDRPAPGVTMSGGKPVQGEVRVKLPPGTSWEQLAALDPAQVKARDLFPRGFLPLPHPDHPAGGMVFPHRQIEETLRQEGRDLARFDLDLDLPDPFLPEFPAPMYLTSRPDLGDVSRGQAITLDNYYEMFNGILNPKQL